MITHLYIKTNLDKSVGTGNKIGNKPPTSSDITILSWNILDTVKRTQKFFLALMLSKDPSHIEQKNPILSIFTLFYPSPETISFFFGRELWMTGWYFFMKTLTQQ